MSKINVSGWSCDERNRKACRNPHGCHCREITALRAPPATEQIRREVIEECAKVADQAASIHRDFARENAPLADKYNTCAEAVDLIAKAIRALAATEQARSQDNGTLAAGVCLKSELHKFAVELGREVQAQASSPAGCAEQVAWWENQCALAQTEIERLRAQVETLRSAAEVLLDEAEGFNVSGVYFSEDCMGHKGPALVRAAIDALSSTACDPDAGLPTADDVRGILSSTACGGASQ